MHRAEPPGARLQSVEPHVVRQWAAEDRLTPWVVYDLQRIAWVIELRAADLTAEEESIVREAATRMLSALPSRDG